MFARYWVEALQDPTADVDKSDSISAMEAFEYAQRKTAAFYESQKRLATEHPVFEDTGKNEPVREPSKSEGVLMANFTVLRIGAAQKQANDPAKQALLRRKRTWNRRSTRSNTRKRLWTRPITSSSLRRRWWSWPRSSRNSTNELVAKIRCVAGIVLAV